MYQWDPERGLRKADRGNVFLKGVEIALEGTYDVKLADGTTVQVRPACELLREKLNNEFTPEKQQAITGVHPDVIRDIARKVATRKTNIMLGYNACKFYHGDLIERAQALLLAVSGNWGKKGTGIRCWASGMHDGAFIAVNKPGPGAANTEIVLSGRDAAIAAFKRRLTMTTEIAVKRLGQITSKFNARGRGDGRAGGGWLNAAKRVPNDSTLPTGLLVVLEAGYDKRGHAVGRRLLATTFDESSTKQFEGVVEDMDLPVEDTRVSSSAGDMLRRTRGEESVLSTLWQLD